jgi:hypothetical protein
VFGYGASLLSYSSDWKSVFGTFALAAKGDSIILYCMDQEAVLKPLSAVTFGPTGWSAAGAVSYETDQSALPPAGLINDNGHMIGLALPHLDNYIYVGSTSGTKSQLLTSLGDSNNWMGSNDVGQLPLPDVLSFDIVTITSLDVGPDHENGKPDDATGDEDAPDAAVDVSLWMSLLCMVVLLTFLMEDVLVEGCPVA